MRSSELKALEAQRAADRPAPRRGHRDAKPAKRNVSREVDQELRASGVRLIVRKEGNR